MVNRVLHYVRVLEEKCRARQWNYGKRYGPHDLDNFQVNLAEERKRDVGRPVRHQFHRRSARAQQAESDGLGGIIGPRNFWERLLWPLLACRECDGRGWRNYAAWPWRHLGPYPAAKACPEGLVTGESVEVKREPCRLCKGTGRLLRKKEMERLQIAIALLTDSLSMQVSVGDHVLLAVGQPLPADPAPKDFAKALRALASKIDAANLGWDDEQQA